MRIRLGVLLFASFFLGRPVPVLHAGGTVSQPSPAASADQEEPRTMPGEPVAEERVVWLHRVQHRSLPFKFVGIDSPENRMATFTPDGHQVAIILWDARVSYYETATGRPARDVWLAPCYESHSQRGHLSDNGLWAAVSDEMSSGTARIRVWDLTTGALKNTIYHSDKLDPFHFYLGADGKVLYHLKEVMSSGKRFVRSWDVVSGKLTLLPTDHPSLKAIRPPPERLTSPDGKYQLEKTEVAPLEVRWQVTATDTGKRLWPELKRVGALGDIQGGNVRAERPLGGGLPEPDIPRDVSLGGDKRQANPAARETKSPRWSDSSPLSPSLCSSERPANGDTVFNLQPGSGTRDSVPSTYSSKASWTLERAVLRIGTYGWRIPENPQACFFFLFWSDNNGTRQTGSSPWRKCRCRSFGTVPSGDGLDER